MDGFTSGNPADTGFTALDDGAPMFNFRETGSGSLGAGIKGEALGRMFTNAIGPLYGPGQTEAAHYMKGIPWAGMNRRDLLTSQPANSPVIWNPTVNSVYGNGAYPHGVIELQQLLNSQAQSGQNTTG